jgi:hypothetical protein
VRVGPLEPSSWWNRKPCGGPNTEVPVRVGAGAHILRDATGSQTACLAVETGSIPVRRADRGRVAQRQCGRLMSG